MSHTTNHTDDYLTPQRELAAEAAEAAKPAPTTWAVTEFAHPDCNECRECAAFAIAEASVTGSVGSSYSKERRAVGGTAIVRHSARVIRALQIITAL